ncbi:putative non-structural maintenance of chromosomes element 4 -like protein A-like [Capsicum annuum]|nr:putative non-structural maintenance of chromosomes element 4 -like protein A-like [Capsicum annuum]KAF3670695.1 putative non-structural maintenance of chromosomes element 4 -like protein A-like [Capsicum annuum]
MKKLNLGPNGGILTSLDLFTTKFDEMRDLGDARIITRMNGPAACLVISGEVKYNQFVFGLDFTDWENMSRNHGKVLREGSNIDNYPEIGDANIRNGNLKRKLL